MNRCISLLLMTLCAAIAGLQTGCTQNNGDITPWFGYWRMTSLTIDGEPEASYDGDITWSFQNNLVFININLPYHEYDESVGTWSSDGTTLTLDFTHAEGQGNYEFFYTPPEVLQIPDDRPADFTRESQNGGTTELRRTLDDGRVMECVLKKIY